MIEKYFLILLLLLQIPITTTTASQGFAGAFPSCHRAEAGYTSRQFLIAYKFYLFFICIVSVIHRLSVAVMKVVVM